jgi:LemA protein
MDPTLLITLAVIVVILVVLAKTYNGLYKVRQGMQQAQSDIEVVISRKLSSINQLMDLVRSFQESEQFTHLKISKDATSQGISSVNRNAEVVLSGLMTVADRFPNLKTNEQYHRLIDSIQEIEIDIQNHRQSYNWTVNNYNEEAFTFPTVLVSGLMGFDKGVFFEMDTSQLNEPVRLDKFQTQDSNYMGQMLEKEGMVKAVADTASKMTAHAWLLSGYDSKGGKINFAIDAQDARALNNGIIMGRDRSACDLWLDDASVSRRHAKIMLIDAQLYIEDLNSSNGTIINGVRLSAGQKTRLKASSQIVVGQLSLNVS